MGENFKGLSKRDLIRLVVRFEERVSALEAREAELEKRIHELEQRNAELEAELARMRKNSSNSSKPPSSDIVKPPKPLPPAESGTRTIGGQLGHPRHERMPFSPDEVDKTREYTLKKCPDCGGRLKIARLKPRVMQQVELVEKPVRVEEHRALTYWCPRCQKVHQAALPQEVERGGLVGPMLTALIGYMKGSCHASYSTIQAFLRDILKTKIARGQLAKVIGKISAALETPYEELRGALPSEAILNIDETGHKENGQPHWTWCFRAGLYTLFKIDRSRGSEVLIDVLGKEFAGVIGADYFSAYRKYMGDFNILVQFCLAHLVRDVKFLTTLPDKVTRTYGERLLDRLRTLFRVIHRRETMTEDHFQKAIEQARRDVVRTAKRAPWASDAQNMAERFRKHGAAYFRFITTPGIDPTNNLAEQAIRFVVIDRRITQGTRGEAGRKWSERIWTVIATCAQRGHSAFDFIQQAVHAHFTGQAAPSLLFNSS